MHLDALMVWRFFISRAGFFRESSAGWVFFLFCSTFTKVNLGFLAPMVVGIQKDWGYHMVKSTTSHGYANGWSTCYELPIGTRTNFLFM